MYRSALVFQMVSTSAAAVCSEDEQSSLLQGRSRPPAKSTPGLLLDSVKHLAQQSKHESPEMVTAGIDSIRTALAQINTELEDEHIGVQGQIDHQFQEIQGCLSSVSHGAAVRDDLTGQLSTMNQCREDLNSARGEQQHVCEAWHNHARRVALTLPSTVLAETPSPADVVQLSRQLREWVQSESPTIESQNTHCDDATSRSNQEEARCSPVIAEYDATFCSHRLKCILLEACHAHEVEVYNTLMADTAGGAEAREAQGRTVAQISCILDFLTDAVTTNTTVADDSLGSCDEDVDVQHLALSFPDVDAMPACPLPGPDDPTCSDVENLELPQSWAGGEEEEIAPAGSGTLFDFPGIFPSASCTYSDFASFPAFDSYTVDMHLTLFDLSHRSYPGVVTSLSYSPPEGGGSTGWYSYIYPSDGYKFTMYHYVRGQPNHGVLISLLDNGIEVGSEFRLTTIYDSTARALTAYINGNVAQMGRSTSLHSGYGIEGNPWLDAPFLSPPNYNIEEGHRFDDEQFPLCVERPEGNAPHYGFNPEEALIRDLKISSGVQLP